MTIVGIKCCYKSKHTFSNCINNHSNIPFSNNSINNNIENDRRDDISLTNSMPCAKRFAKVSSRLRDD
jgi:hypothetical protein